MPNPRLAARYAKSLLDLTIERNSLEETLKDMQLLDAICKQSRDFTNMMRSPIIKADKKTAITDAVLKGRISHLTESFIKLLINKGREQALDEIAVAFIMQYRAYKRVSIAKLTTAAAVDNTVIDILRTKIQAANPEGTIDFQTAVDPNLIGGFILELGDRQLDASILRELNEIKKQFSKNLYVAQM
jgi:F-type H+-transporting ATPase subunit delta